MSVCATGIVWVGHGVSKAINLPSQIVTRNDVDYFLSISSVLACNSPDIM